MNFVFRTTKLKLAIYMFFADKMKFIVSVE